ncbi:MAG: hypothetical protein AAF609_07070 [Cyanobacteria bacterium P01_C01_bin.120]
MNLNPIVPFTTRFGRAWQSLATSRWWSLALLTVGTASNVMYAHTPLVAFAVVSGITLQRRRASAIAVLIWLVNQSVGFGLRGYPLSVTASSWGALMGLGTLLVALFASWRPSFARTLWTGHVLWWAIALLVGFVLYQGLILLVYPLMADGHWMDWAIIAKLLAKNLAWAGTLAIVHGLFLWRQLITAPLVQPRL